MILTYSYFRTFLAYFRSLALWVTVNGKIRQCTISYCKHYLRFLFKIYKPFDIFILSYLNRTWFYTHRSLCGLSGSKLNAVQSQSAT